MKDRYVLKVCISGYNTDLISQVIRNTGFSTNYMPSIGVDICTKVITVNDQEVKLILHFTVGCGPYFGKLRKFYYEGSVGNVIVFDKSDPTSFSLIPSYYQEYQEVQGAEKPIAILGVITNSEEVSTEQAQQLATNIDCLYYECPSTNGPCMQEVVESLIRHNINREAIDLPDFDHLNW